MDVTRSASLRIYLSNSKINKRHNNDMASLLSVIPINEYERIKSYHCDFMGIWSFRRWNYWGNR